MTSATGHQIQLPPGTEEPRRFRPRLRYELIGCGLQGHELLGTDVAEIRPEDRLVVRVDDDGLRWYRCLRCDSWLSLLPPKDAPIAHMPPREEVSLPLRGRPLRDKYVLRVIAVDRMAHFVLLAVIAAAIFAFNHDRGVLNGYWVRILRDLQAGAGGPTQDSSHGLVGELNKLFSTSSTHLLLAGFAISAYALLEGVEGIGLWMAKRWAEYLTFGATALLLVPEIYELTTKLSVLKLITLVLNIAVVVYLLFAKRLFGLRGGARADEEERERDTGWEALERTLPSIPHASVSEAVATRG